MFDLMSRRDSSEPRNASHRDSNRRAKQKGQQINLLALVMFGRCERIRTFDPLHPMQVRYQAAPHTDRALNYTRRKHRFPG